jgi:hypothetical protein
MNQQDFCYWLNGFIELNEGKMPTPAQWKSICEHLGLVFNKVTPALKKDNGLSEIKPNLAEIIEKAKRDILDKEKKYIWIKPFQPIGPPDFRPGPLVGPNDYPPGLTITC